MSSYCLLEDKEAQEIGYNTRPLLQASQDIFVLMWSHLDV